MSDPATLEGIIKLTAKGSGWFIDPEGKEDIAIASADLATALHGDTVAIMVNPSREGEPPTGKVVKIIARKKMRFAGLFEMSGDKAYVVPDDQKMYADIAIPPTDLGGAKAGQKVFAEITSWSTAAPGQQTWPIGKIIRVLGQAGDHNTEMLAIVLEKGLTTDFPPEVEAGAQKLKTDTKISPEGRRDFRDITTFTIDPITAKDFDDALSLKALPDGQYEVGIHIADVSYYVTPGTKLDEEARRRATSIYLVDRTIPMLPEILSNDLCSLVEKQDRLTYGAVFTFSPTGDITDRWFGRTIINSDKRFTYEEAQLILDGGPGPFGEELKVMNKLAGILRAAKIAAGAISFPDDELQIILDEAGKPIDIKKKVRQPIHLLVEDFMLLANREVAAYATEKSGGVDGKFVYRIHDEPDPEKIETLADFVRPLGYDFKAHGGVIHSSDINKLLKQVAGQPEQSMIQTAAMRSMSKAIYSVNNIGHYGLAFRDYTHFTSPIRRYPDVMVHRLLSIYLAGDKPSAELMADYTELSLHASKMEQAAAEAERESIKYKQVEYLQNQIGTTRPGIIAGIADWGLYVEDIATKAEGLVRLKSLGDDFYTFDEKNYCLVGRRTGKKYRLGDPVNFTIIRADVEKKQLDYVLASEIK